MNEIPKGELGRKAIHYATSLIPLIYYFYIGKDMAVWILIVISVFLLIAEFARKFIPFFRSLYMKLFGDMTRPHEYKNHLTGATYVSLGSLLVIYLFPKEIAVVALLFLMVGDPTACLVGMSFGKIKIMRDKTLEGALAFILASLIVTWWIPNVPFSVKLIGACAASLFELIPWKLDDNLTIPSLSALFMYYML